MNCCQCEPMVALNAEGHRLVKILKILFFCYLALIVAKIVIGDFNGALSNVISMIILLLAFLQCNYLICGFLIFFSCFNLFYSLVFIGLRIQNNTAGIPDRFTSSGLYISGIIIAVVSIGFYITLIYYAFKSYKEFKALLFNSGGYSIYIYNCRQCANE